MNVIKVPPHVQLAEYRETLAFCQSELLSDRKKLDAAKKRNASAEEIFQLEKDITTLELGVDRYQGFVKVLQQNIESNEAE
tara:strand:- start:4996 stop:5238 length:243 start_codon:yes stop_codon:yes gene_type:complete